MVAGPAGLELPDACFGNSLVSPSNDQPFLDTPDTEIYLLFVDQNGSSNQVHHPPDLVRKDALSLYHQPQHSIQDWRKGTLSLDGQAASSAEKTA